ncbi:MAG: hypothetical protein JOZ82_06490 [Marmoricola sp.]|nr:hypothetical protein [Marmoricola sp.]
MPCLATGVVIGCTYWLTARFFGWAAGLAAAVLVIANSVMLVNASRLYPDPVAMAMVMLAVIAAVLARDRWARTPRVDAWLVVLLLLVGTFVGLSWWMRETALLEWPVVAAVLLWRGGPPRRWSIPLAAVPAAALLALEMFISARAFGSPMERFTALTSGDLSSTTNAADMPYLNQSRFAYLTTMPRGFLGFEDGRWMLAMAVIAVVSLIVAPRKTGLFAGWFVVVFLLFTAVGGGLRPAHPNLRLDVARYWVAYLPPMVMAAVAGSTLALRRARTWLEGRTPARVGAIVPGVVAVLLVAGAVSASAAGVRANPSYVVTNGNVTASFRNWLHAHDKQVRVVYSDWMSGRVLPVYAQSFSGTPMAHVTWMSLTGTRPPHRGDYVVLYSPYDQVCFFCNANLNMSWLKDHRGDLRHWKKVWQSDHRTFVVYKVTGRPKA